MGRESSLDVPANIHFLWLGKVIPNKYLDNLETFRSAENYDIYLWTDSVTLYTLNETIKRNFKVMHYKKLDYVNHDIIEKEAIGTKTDLIRYEIVYQYGGIYCDTDCVRNKPIPPILKKSFVSTITSGEAYIYAGIFGFAKGSNFLKFLIETVGASYLNIKDYNKLWIPVKSGPIFFTAMFLHFYDTRINMIDKDYLVTQSNNSIIYQTLDHSWR